MAILRGNKIITPLRGDADGELWSNVEFKSTSLMRMTFFPYCIAFYCLKSLDTFVVCLLYQK